MWCPTMGALKKIRDLFRCLAFLVTTATDMREDNDHLGSLRAFGVLSLVLPLLVALTFGMYRYIDAQGEFELKVNRSLRVANEHASKVLVISEALQDRIGDQVAGRPVADIEAREAVLHALLQELIKTQTQIRTIWILGPDGKTLVSSRAYPACGVDMTDRKYLQAHKSGPGMRLMSNPLVGRGSGEEIIDFSVGFPGPDGSLGGVINIGLATSYMKQFYSDLASNEPGLAVALFNRGGDIYARWPAPTPGAARMGPDIPLMRSIFSGADEGTLTGTSSDGERRLISYRRVSDAYPLYVGAGMSISALRMAMLKDFAVLLAFGLPPFMAFWLAIRAAMKRARLAAQAADELALQTSSRRKAEQALIQSQKLEALSRVAGGVAHEFNNALMVISSNIHLLAKVAQGPNKRLESMRRAVDGATQLTRQLLSFTRRQALAPKALSPSDALVALSPLLLPILGGRIELRVDVEPGLSEICVDEAELELALVNLAINARDAMPSGGVLTLRAQHVVDESVGGVAVRIDVLDTGVGIEPEVLSRVFEPFFTTKEIGAGTGLGLTQVRSFCERVAGVARIESVVGGGCTVSLVIPAARAGAQTRFNAQPTAASLAPGKSVLLVEDDDLVAEVLIPMLESFGCQATRVDRAAKALSWLDSPEHQPDIVVSDVRMPGEIDGLGLARKLRERRPDLPLLLLTGYTDELSDIELEKFPVLPKPCTPEALRLAIARIVG